MKKEKGTVTAWSYLRLSLYAFLAVGMDGVLLMVESSILGKDFSEFSAKDSVIHWMIICIIWGMFAFYFYRCSKKMGFDLLKERMRPDKKGLIIAILLTIACIVEMTISFGGFKPIVEMQHKTRLMFVFQYVYYLFEVAVFLEILVFGHKFGEKRFGDRKIPYGGCILALTWGLAHFLSKNFVTGIESVVFALVFGTIYLCVNKNTKLTYFFFACAFLL